MENEISIFEAGEKYEWGTCPVCKASWKFEEEQAVNSLTIPLDDLINPKRKKQLSYYICLNLYVCPTCKGEVYFVEVNVIKNPNVSEDWQRCFFKRHCSGKDLVTGEKETNITINPVKGYGCWVEKTPTVEGIFCRSCIGPFIPQNPLYGPTGVYSCPGTSDWKHAAWVASVWINNFSLFDFAFGQK